MPGPVIKAGQVASEYGSRYADRKNGKVVLKNSEGKKMEVSPKQDVYHRGKGKFAAYSTERDKKIKARTGKDPKKTGSGPYRHTGDKRKGENGTKKSEGKKASSEKRHAPRTVHRKTKPVKKSTKSKSRK